MTRPRFFSKSLVSHLRCTRPQPVLALAILAGLICASVSMADPVINYSDYPDLTTKGTYQFSPSVSKIAAYGRYVYCLVDPSHSDEITMLRWNPTSDSFTNLGTLDVNALSLHDIVVTGHYLCVSYRNEGDFVRVYDVSTPSSPYLLSTTLYEDPLNFMTPFVYGDGIARFIAKTPYYSAWRVNLYSLDPNDGSLSIPGHVNVDGSTSDIVVRNTSVYLAWTIATNSCAVRGIDWSSIQYPIASDPYELTMAPVCITVDNEERRLYMSRSYQGSVPWSSIGITNKEVSGPEVVYDTSALTTAQLYYDPFLLRGVSTSGDKLWLYDASLPGSPDFYASSCISENPQQIEAFADSIYSQTGTYLNALIINQAYPAGSAGHPYVSATDIVPYHRQGGSMSVCYVAGSDGIRAYYTSVPPLSDPLAPALVQGWGLANGFTVNSLSLSDNDMLVACIGRNVHTWKIGADPTQLTAFKTCQVPVDHSAEKALVYAGKLYVACGGPTGHLRVYSMPATEAGSITFLWEADTAGSAVDLVVQKKGTYVLAYVAEGNAGIEIFRTGDANGITKRGGLDTDDAQSIAIQGLTLYVADGAGGAKVIDATTPTSPVLLATLCGRDVQDVCVSGQELYALDGKLVRVFDVTTPSSPVRRGFLNAEAVAKALNATNRLWLTDDDMIKLAYMQVGSAPAVVPTTEKADVYLDVSSNVMVWEFSWRTKEWTNPDLMKVVVRNPVTPSPGCLDFGATGMTFGYGDVGVTTFVRPSVDGGWLNTLRMEVGSCDTDCQYAFKGRCAIEANGMAYSETDEVSYSTPVCVQYQPGEE